MKIISIRKGFTADHSSTSYEFLAVDKALGKQEKAEVSALSRRASPTSRRVSFSYNVDGYDIPGGWEKLMARYYDVMYSESYDWWTLALAFNTDEKQIEEIKQYEFSGEEDAGVTVRNSGNRIIVAIYCRIYPEFFMGSSDEYEDEDEGGEDERIDDERKEVRFVAEDKLLNLLVQVRAQIIKRDYRTLYAVWERYRYSDEEEEEYNIPVPEKKKAGKSIVSRFRDMLDEVE